MAQPEPAALFALALLLVLLISASPASFALAAAADCSSCDHSLTAPVYYGCIGSAYVEYDSATVDCGAALSLNTTSSTPRFFYPDADPDEMYALLLIDTTDIDPHVGTVAPFLPHPVIHYGAVNIEGDVLIEGVDMGLFHLDKVENRKRVEPFLEYQCPVPQEDLTREQPDYIPPDINTRAFNYEFILGRQSKEKQNPNMDKHQNWEFIGFLRRTIVGNPVASTYISTGFCVKDVFDDASMGSDCPVPAKTGSGIGRVPAHVAVISPDTSDSSPVSSSGPSESESQGNDSGGSPGANQGDSDASDSGAFGKRLSVAAFVVFICKVSYLYITVML